MVNEEKRLLPKGKVVRVTREAEPALAVRQSLQNPVGQIFLFVLGGGRRYSVHLPQITLGPM